MRELYELPEGWEWKKLEDIIRIGCERGFKPTLINGKVPFIGMTDIDKHTGRNTKYILEDNDKVSKGKTKFQKNAILLGKITPCTQNNKTTIVPNDIDGGYATTEVYALHCLEKIEPLYFNYYIRSKRVNEFLVSSMIGATGRQRVPSDTVKNLIIPLPPLQEQKRIVAKLDALFEKIDRAIALHQKNMDEADAFMGSVLNDVFGELEGQYPIRKVDEVSLNIRYGYTDSAKDKGNAVFIRITDIKENGKFKDNFVYVNIQENELNKFRLYKGDILVARSGATAGKVALFDLEAVSVFASYLIRIQPNDNMSSSYFFYFCHSPQYWNQLVKIKVGGAQPNVNATNLKELKLPLPPLKIQQKTVNYLDKISSHIERVKELQKEKMQYLKALKASILDQAFRGKL